MKAPGLAAALTLTLAMAACAEQVFVTLDEQGPGTTMVEAHYFIRVPRETAWAVLTDYDHLSRFVSSMKTSRVVERGPNTLKVEQHAEGGMFFVKRAMSIVLDIHEQPMQRIDFDDVSHTDFDYYRGSWEIEQSDARLVILYHLYSKRHFSGPGFVKRHFIKKMIFKLMSQVEQEMLRRAGPVNSLNPGGQGR